MAAQDESFHKILSAGRAGGGRERGGGEGAGGGEGGGFLVPIATGESVDGGGGCAGGRVSEERGIDQVMAVFDVEQLLI